MAVTVEVSFWIEGIHFWEQAPDHIGYLRFPHRHRIKVVAGVNVAHLDREIEFHTLQNEVKHSFPRLYGQDENGLFLFGERSCETIAQEILDDVVTPLSYVSVSEDGENRSIVTKE